MAGVFGFFFVFSLCFFLNLDHHLICILTPFTFSSTVFQMTGRKGRVVSNDDGTITYESRSELDVPVEILNLTEKQRFMDGEKVKAKLVSKWGKM